MELSVAVLALGAMLYVCPSVRAAGPCDVYLDCVQCKTFGTGSLGIMECIAQCEFAANYNPIEAAPGGGAGWATLCKAEDEEACVFTFLVGGLTDDYTDLYIDTELQCPQFELTRTSPVGYEPDYTTETSVEGPRSTETSTEETTTDYIDGAKTTKTVATRPESKTNSNDNYVVKSEDSNLQSPVAVSGTDHTQMSDNQNQPDNGARITSVSIAALTVCVLSVLCV